MPSPALAFRLAARPFGSTGWSPAPTHISGFSSCGHPNFTTLVNGFEGMQKPPALLVAVANHRATGVLAHGIPAAYLGSEPIASAAPFGVCVAW